MAQIFNLLGFFSVVLVLLMQWQIYVLRITATFALSSLIIGAALIYAGIRGSAVPVAVLGVLTAAVRGVVIPLVIARSLHTKPYRVREQSPAIPTATSIFISLALVLFGYALYNLALADFVGRPSGFLPIALLLQGGFLIVSRRNAFIQFIGYLVMENAVLLLGSLVLPGLPFIVEAGVVLDLMGAVVVSRIIMRLRESAVEGNGYHHKELVG